MRLNDISTLAAGNAFLHEFVERFNTRFAKPALIAVDARRELMHTPTELDLRMSFQSQRKISKNLEVRYNSRVYQLAAYSGEVDLPFWTKAITCARNAPVLILAILVTAFSHFAHDFSHRVTLEFDLVSVVQ